MGLTPKRIYCYFLTLDFQVVKDTLAGIPGKEGLVKNVLINLEILEFLEIRHYRFSHPVSDHKFLHDAQQLPSGH
jgi:hypothetical protein